MSELDAARREALAVWFCARYYDCAQTWDEPAECDHGFGYRDAGLLLDAPLIAKWVAEAEQRGREDNADHGMCYVHGSRALEARLAEAKGEALREAATDPSLRLSGHSGISITRLLDRADDLRAARPHDIETEEQR